MHDTVSNKSLQRNKIWPLQDVPSLQVVSKRSFWVNYNNLNQWPHHRWLFLYGELSQIGLSYLSSAWWITIIYYEVTQIHGHPLMDGSIQHQRSRSENSRKSECWETRSAETDRAGEVAQKMLIEWILNGRYIEIIEVILTFISICIWSMYAVNTSDLLYL